MNHPVSPVAAVYDRRRCIDMSPEAVSLRLRQVDELRELCLALAGPRLKRPWGVPSLPRPVAAVYDRRSLSSNTGKPRRSQTAATTTSGNVPGAATNQKTS